MRIPADGLGNYRAGKEIQRPNPLPLRNLYDASPELPGSSCLGALHELYPFSILQFQGHFRSEILFSYACHSVEGKQGTFHYLHAILLPICARACTHWGGDGPCVFIFAPGSQLAKE